MSTDKARSRRFTGMRIQMRNLIGLLISLMLLVSCLPQQKPSSTRKKTSSGTTEETTTVPTPETPDLSLLGEVSWYSGNQNFNNIITLNEDLQTVIYLRGESINTFLASSLDGSTLNQNRTYCLVASFNHASSKKNLRVRAVPVSFFNFEKATQERVLRVDIPDSSSSSATCSGTAYQITTTVDAGTSVSTLDTSFSLPGVCTNCTGIINSTDVSLYLASSSLTVNDRVPESSINLNDLILRIDTQSGSIEQGGSCSDSACNAKGFDCCLEGQCVKDGSLRPNASSQTDFTQALVDVSQNPANFKNWPSVYFVCASNPPTPLPTPTPLPDAQATASARLEEMIKDFNCLEEGKKATPDFAGNNVCEPSFDQTGYEAVRSKVWAYCGCEADPFPTDPEDPVCPDFGLEATRNLAGNIIDVTCLTPDPPAQPTPFQDLSLSVNTRAAPHRFYRADTGESVDDITTLETTVLPEGTPFQYTDDSSKTDPDCSGDATGASSAECSYNLNAILGQFNVELNQARPAVVVNLDFDQSYVISTISGFYTPCPTCAADYWFQSFTAYPASQLGVGLEGVGYQTNREFFGNNNPRGNYEDTHFGRACFLPPTMIPFSHNKDTNVITQRQNRLLTQTALWVNGYQRDWFGFNRGALIGSFDGVKWFAIGKNRRVNSTTGKLFLAINAPFADLTDPSDIIVQIVLDQGSTTAPIHEYDPNFGPDSPEQNSGASCQAWHQCNTDTDCITRLGWEYMCIDTNNFRTKWPKFDVEANEVADDEFDTANFARILQGGMPGGNRKRCVYRGSGALCKRDYTTGLTNNRRKMFACAPNFHCASLDASEFNDQIARTPNKFTSIVYGMEADILGRPLNYAEANATLPDVVKETLIANGLLYTTETTDLGLCRPGRQTTNLNAIRQHEDKDSGGRTDYIGQVGVCNSSQTGTLRTVACPVIENEEDQLTPKGDLILAYDTKVNDFDTKALQNACGAEGKDENQSIPVSPFSTVEADPIRFLNNLVTPAVAKDACLRRAGSICHTDLDCAPNRLHEGLAFAQSRDQFGGTNAELQFWQESLICSQAAEEPFPNSTEYFDYDMSKNRCCRETGKDFTMYSQVIYNAADTENPNLDVTAFPYINPEQPGRYSRYASVQAEDNPTATAVSTPYAQAPIVDISGGNIPRAFQWKTFNDTGKNTCCGGGWVRKFNDGTTSWNDASRLKINPTNFECLNYHQEIPIDEPISFFMEEQNLLRELDRFCLSPLDGGCNQIEFPSPTGDGTLVLPKRKSNTTLPSNAISTRAVLDTTPFGTQAEGFNGMADLNFNVPFEPIPYPNSTPLNGSDPADRFTFFNSPTDYFGVSFYLPSYIGYVVNQATQENGGANNLISVYFAYYQEDGTYIGGDALADRPLDRSPGGAGATCTITTNPEADLLDNEFCIINESSGLVFHGRADTTVIDGDGEPWAYAAVVMEFRTQNGAEFIYGGTLAGSQPSPIEGMFRGNELYYLTKLGRLELLGIPQIVYEPIYCNTNNSKLVDGIFTNMTTRDDFNAGSISMADNSNLAENNRPLIAMYDDRYSSPNSSITANYDTNGDGIADITDDAALYNFTGAAYSDVNEKFVFRTDADKNEVISLPPIFSENEFRCCVGLGQASSEDAKCCSGNRDSDGICKLPVGANLHVYFNKFVSGEGMGEDLPGGGLLEADFIPETGEPKISDTVLNKIRQLGVAFCESGEVRGGGAFGFFIPEPNTGQFQHREAVNIDDTRKYSIIDSTRDFDPDSESGTSPFLAGFRWDHHLYCAPGSSN